MLFNTSAGLGTYRGVNTVIFKMETCSLYDWHQFNVVVSTSAATDFVNYIQSLDSQVSPRPI